VSLPPPPPPPTEADRGGVEGGGADHWEAMDFSAKRSKLGASINLSMMRPGAAPPVGLRRSVIQTEEDDEEDAVGHGEGNDESTVMAEASSAEEQPLWRTD